MYDFSRHFSLLKRNKVACALEECSVTRCTQYGFKIEYEGPDDPGVFLVESRRINLRGERRCSTAVGLAAIVGVGGGTVTA